MHVPLLSSVMILDFFLSLSSIISPSSTTPCYRVSKYVTHVCMDLSMDKSRSKSKVEINKKAITAKKTTDGEFPPFQLIFQLVKARTKKSFVHSNMPNHAIPFCLLYFIYFQLKRERFSRRVHTS